MTFTPIPTFTKMPAPLDSASADGVDAYSKSISTGNTNFGYLPSWSGQYISEAYTGTEYSTITPGAGWTITFFRAIAMNKMVTIDLIGTYNAAITFLADGSLSAGVVIGTGLPAVLRPALTTWTGCMDARLASTAVFVTIGWPAVSDIAINSGSIPSRTIPANSQLIMHAAYFNQVAETTLTP